MQPALEVENTFIVYWSFSIRCNSNLKYMAELY